MLKNFFLLLLLLIIYCSNSLAVVENIYSFPQSQQSEQFNRLIHQLRCLVCQNENLADSNAELAKDLRNQVFQMVNQGKTDAEIKNFLVARYGDFILFKPPLNPQTYLLWFAPLVLLILGIFIIKRFIRKAS